MIVLEKYNKEKPISAVYYDGHRESYFVKRFLIEDMVGKYSFITDHKDSRLELVSVDWRPQVEVIFVKEKGKNRRTEVIVLDEFISVKGFKALGNRLTNKKVKDIKKLDSLDDVSLDHDNISDNTDDKGNKENKKPNVSDEGAQQITLEL